MNANDVAPTAEKHPPPAERLLPRGELQRLIDALAARAYRILGPVVEQGAIAYGDVRIVDDLPRGWTDVQQPGSYRLSQRDDDAYFGYSVGPHSWKRYLFPPREIVATAEQTEAGWSFDDASPNEPVQPLAFLGVRACELAAIAVQDRVFLHGPYVDENYRRRREACCIVAVNCTQAAATCFCTSFDTGPECRFGFDLALTELPHGFVVQVGSDLGSEIAAELPCRPISSEELADAAVRRGRAREQTRSLDVANLRDDLLARLEHPHWQDVASRCLSCGNCTLACPTCFCASVNEVTDLTGDRVERERTWTSCFDIDFSYLNGGRVRNSIHSRYRQWLTHKLATWHDQFGQSGCVGCGRCITWCPTGIDLIAEVAALRAPESTVAGGPA